MRKCIGFPSPVFSMAIAGVVYGCVSETKRAVAYVRLHFATAPRALSVALQYNSLIRLKLINPILIFLIIILQHRIISRDILRTLSL